MNRDTSLYAELSYLILLYVEGKIQQHQFERLDTLLQSNPNAREAGALARDVAELGWRYAERAINPKGRT